MAEGTKIEWADHTFNPWEGCQKTGSLACDLCYAERRNARFAPKGQPRVAPNWGPGAPRRRTSRQNWLKPLRWQADAGEFFKLHGRKQRVFSGSLCDIFDNAVDSDWRADLFRLIEETPDLIWMLLTKRIGNVAKMLPERWNGKLPDNVWIGATIVTQEEADRDIPKLLQVPATVHFLSMEPLMEYVNIAAWLHWLDWIIVGGESGGPDEPVRPMHPAWVEALFNQVTAAGKAFFFKQWGDWLPFFSGGSEVQVFMGPNGKHYEGEALHRFDDGQWSARVGKKLAGRMLHGFEHNAVPVR